MVFCGCGAMTINEITNGSISHVGVAVTWGLIVMAMIYAFGEISGAHFNPAVTIGFAFAKKFAWNKVPKYILAQAIGAIFAAFLNCFKIFSLSLEIKIYICISLKILTSKIYLFFVFEIIKN